VFLSRKFAVIFWLCFATTIAFPCYAEKKNPPVVRWTANEPGCEFHHDENGRHRWRMVGDALDINLIIDSQELAKSRRRFYHLFAAYLTVTYTGHGSFEFPADVRVTFLRHHNVTEASNDPTELQTRLQNDVDSLVFETERQIKKHPEQKDEKTARLREYQKEAAEFIEFVSTESLQPTTLTPGNSVAQGWVFFATNNKWIGPWNPREDFILLVWMKDKVWQFPFSLPPGEGDVILRKREQ